MGIIAFSADESRVVVTAAIVDNRDGEITAVRGFAHNVHDAKANAFTHAVMACDEWNRNEGWRRFVPLTWKALNRLNPKQKGT
jgi:hypothetical protein